MAYNKYNNFNQIGYQLQDVIANPVKFFLYHKTCKKCAQRLIEVYEDNTLISKYKNNVNTLAMGFRYLLLGTDGKVTKGPFYNGLMKEEDFRKIVNKQRGKTGGVEKMLEINGHKEWNDIEFYTIAQNEKVQTRTKSSIYSKRFREGFARKNIDWKSVGPHAIALRNYFIEVKNPKLNMYLAKVLNFEYYNGENVITNRMLSDFFKRNKDSLIKVENQKKIVVPKRNTKTKKEFNQTTTTLDNFLAA